jgi:hypothetical protein
VTLPRKAQKFLINDRCSGKCTLSARNLPIAEQVHTWFEMGDNNATILTKAQKIGFKLSNGAVGRHFANHLVREDTVLAAGRAFGAYS